MANTTKSSWVVDGVTSIFSIPFNYISRDYIKVYLNGISTIAFSFLTDSQIKLNSSPKQGTTVTIMRVTPRSPLVTFSDDSYLNASDLNIALGQLHDLQAEKDYDATDLTEAVLSAQGAAHIAEESISTTLAQAAAASNSANAAAASVVAATAAAADVPNKLLNMATSLIDTQTILAQHIAFV